jgi:ribonuclease D
VQRAETMPPTEWPQPVQHVNNGKSVDAIVDVMNAIVRLRADENNVAAPVLASRDDLSHLAHGEKNVSLLNSWRYVIVGKELQDFLEGKITISIENGNLVIARTEEE